jgi:hypothetical protein
MVMIYCSKSYLIMVSLKITYSTFIFSPKGSTVRFIFASITTSARWLLSSIIRVTYD